MSTFTTNWNILKPAGTDFVLITDIDSAFDTIDTALTTINGNVGGATGALLKNNNLSDLQNVATARNNLGLGTMASQSSTSYLAVANNLSELNNPSAQAAARSNLGISGTGTLNSSSSVNLGFLGIGTNVNTMVRPPFQFGEIYCDSVISTNITSTSTVYTGTFTNGSTAFTVSPSLNANDVGGTIAAITGGTWPAVTATQPLIATQAGSSGTLSVAALFSGTATFNIKRPTGVFSISDYRTFTSSQATVNQGDQTHAFGVEAAINVANGVTLDGYAGMTVHGFVDLNSSGLINNGVAYAGHFDILGSSPSGTWAFAQAHMGSLGTNGTAIGYDIAALNSIGGSWANAIGFRMPDSANLVGATNAWGFAIGNYQSCHRGKLNVGGTSELVAPIARLHVRETQNTVSFRIEGYGGPTNDNVTETWTQGSVVTTDAAQHQVVAVLLEPNAINVIEVTILAHRTAGGGKTDDGGAMRVMWVTQGNQGPSNTAPPTIGPRIDFFNNTSPYLTMPQLGANFNGVQGININGIINTTYAWHASARVWQVNN